LIYKVLLYRSKWKDVSMWRNAILKI
jgi:hypothetical protein